MVKFYVQVSPLFHVCRRYVSDVLSSSSAVSSLALGLWTALRRSFSCPSSPRRLVLRLACLCTSVSLGICPRGHGRFLMGFHELANESTDSQFQFLDRDAWRQPWFGHACLIIFLVAGHSREGEIPGSRILCGSRVLVSLGLVPGCAHHTCDCPADNSSRSLDVVEPHA